ERGLLRILVAHEAGYLRRQPDGQAALLVEVERKVLAVRTGGLDPGRRLAADALLGERLHFEFFAFQGQDRDRDQGQIGPLLFAGARVFIQRVVVAAELPPALVAGQHGDALDRAAAEVAFELLTGVVQALRDRLGRHRVVAAHEGDRPLRLPGDPLD